MDYPNRIALFSVASLALHLTAVLVIVAMPGGNGQIARAERIEPIVLALNPPRPAREQKLIERGAVTDEALKDTDFISDANTRAQDQAEEVGDESRPSAEETSDVDQMPRPELTPAMSAEPAAPVAPEESVAEETPQSAPAPPAPVVEAPSEPVELSLPAAAEAADAEPAFELLALSDAVEDEAPAEDEAEPEDESEDLERFEVAQAEAPPQAYEQAVAVQSVRVGGGVSTKGFTSFEARKHEMGEYMLDVRHRVERNWRSGLLLRYGGSTRTYAVVKCSIRPDGTLAYVDIVDYGPSPPFASLCRDAIVNAHFDEFPFDVPEIYRTKDLEIMWRFSYM